MLAELSLLGRAWYPDQLVQSWGAQQGAGEKGSPLPGLGRFPLLDVVGWEVCG